MATTEKTCFKCLCKLPLEAFYRHSKTTDGRLGKCKECTKKDVIANRLLKIEHYRQYDVMRASQPHRINLTKNVVAKYRKDYPNRTRANAAVARAIRSKKLVQWPCQVCGNEKSIGHHADYDNFLGVVWLCQIHHKQLHLEASRLTENA
jgi:hypothetical protein